MKKRILASLMCLCLLVGLLPTTALAAEGDALANYASADGQTSEEPVPLAEAVEKLNEAGGGTITVVQSGTAAADLEINSDITIVAEAPVTVTAGSMTEDASALFRLAEGSSLTLGREEPADGTLTFTGGGQPNSCLVASLDQIYAVDADEAPTLTLHDGVVLTGCTAGAVGKQITVTTSTGKTQTQTYTVQLVMDGGAVTGNGSPDQPANMVGGVLAASLNMTGGEISHNHGTQGGAVTLFSLSDTEQRVSGDAVIADCSATEGTGGITSTGHLVVSGSAQIRECTGNGGGISVALGTVTITDEAVISDCTGLLAGGIAGALAEKVTLSGNAKIERCTALGSEEAPLGSGGVLAMGCHFTMTDNAVISDCTGIWGGGLSLITGISAIDAPHEISGSARLVGNRAEAGGAIYVVGQPLVISGDVVISNNTAEDFGGAIYLDPLSEADDTVDELNQSHITISGGRVSGNSAPQGGGIFVGGAEQNLFLAWAQQTLPGGFTPAPCILTLEGGEITGNRSTDGEGGGIYLSLEADASLSGGVTVSGNQGGQDQANNIYLPAVGSGAYTEGWDEFLAGWVEEQLDSILTELWDQMKDLPRESLLEAAISQGVLPTGSTGEGFSDDDLRNLIAAAYRDFYRPAIYIQGIEAAVEAFETEYGISPALPALDEFKSILSNHYADYFSGLLDMEYGNATQEELDELATQLGLIEEGGTFSGTLDDLRVPFVNQSVANYFDRWDDEDWEDAYEDYYGEPCTVLSSQATLDITGKLTGAVGVTSAMPEVGRLVAQGLGYTASEADRAAFTSDDPSYTVALEGGRLVLARQITLTPQNMTAYTGGDSISEDPFPSVRYTITGEGLNTENIADLTFTVDGEESGSPEQMGEGNYWLLSGVDNTFTAKTRAAATDDGAAGDYEIGVDAQTITATDTEGTEYKVVVADSGTLTVRNVSDPAGVLDEDEPLDIAQPVVKDAGEVNTDDGIAVALIPEGTSFYTNGKEELGVLGKSADADDPDAAPQISLLFDELIPAEGGENTRQLLVDRAAGEGYTLTADNSQFKYLDLINEHDGNAWVSTDNGTSITIYWPCPDGVTAGNYTVQVLHFKGLHREYRDNLAEQVENCEVEPIDARIEGENVVFTLTGNKDAGSFSPFALTWTANSSGGGGGGGGTTRYTITASAEDGGSISPSGSVSVTRGSDKTFTIRADSGYEIADVLVDGESVGAVRSYTFENVREKHTIRAEFRAVKPVADPDNTGVSRWLNVEDHMAYLTGYPDGSFGPDRSMTRAEVAQMFYALLLDQDVELTASFSDVPAGAWYSRAVNTLASLGMVEGVGGGRFDPDRAITRAEFTTIAMGFAYKMNEGEAGFPDVSESDWFYPYVMSAAQYGWIGGYGDGTFRPYNTITRAEVTTIVNNMLARAADKDYVDDHTASLRQFPDVAEGYWGYYQIMEAANSHSYDKSDGVEDWTRLLK